MSASGVRILQPAAVLLLCALLLAACGGDEAVDGDGAASGGHPLLGRAAETIPTSVPAPPESTSGLATLTVDYPQDESVFPPEFVSPTFLWHDEAEAADTWWIHVAFTVPGAADVDVLVPGAPPPRGEVDPEAIGETNEVYQPTPYQASARSWTPSAALWETIKARCPEAEATVTITGLRSSAPIVPISVGRLRITTSADPVGAPIFYRDVPLMPAVGETGVIQPLSHDALPLIGWRLKDVSRTDSKLLLTGMPSCANCHSFSQDGKTLGMDVDGPGGDKGAYAVAPIQESMQIGREQVLTWNSFPDKPEGHKTIGFLSQVSPDGRYVVSTVNEALYVANFANHRILQVFYPTRGILAWTSTETGGIHALPGADSKAYVHCDPAWTPDGKKIVFARGKARDPYDPAVPLARYPNDPNETEMRYDLVRMPFDEGRGGPRTLIEGASDNGMSNTFPKVSPDGKWIVFVKCRNGQLLRPDGRLWIVPFAGGDAREMRCNQERMNSWHSFSPNGRWMVFSSKGNTPYTQMFLTHLDADGNDTPAILILNATAANRAVNIPEFLNAPYDALSEIAVPAANHHLHFQRGLALMNDGKLLEARPFFVKALAEEPDFSRAHAALGSIDQRTGRRERARQHFEAALATSDENARVLTNFGLLLFEDGEDERAMKLWRRAIEIDPFDPFAHNDLGMALGKQNRFAEAERHFQQALEIQPDHIQAHSNLGLLDRRRGRLPEARKHYEDALRLDEKDRGTRTALASLLTEMGLAGSAITQYETLLRAHEDDVAARTHLAWILATTPSAGLRDGTRALQLAKRAVARTGGKEPHALDALAAALAETGNFQGAVQAAARALAAGDRADPELVREITARLRLYQAGRPYRAPR